MKKKKEKKKKKRKRKKDEYLSQIWSHELLDS